MNASVLELMCIAYFGMILLFFNQIDSGIQRAAVFLPVSSILFVCLTAQKRGIVASLMSKRILVHLGNNTLFYYLCHRTVLSYSYFGLKALHIDATRSGLNWMMTFICLLIVILLGEVYFRFKLRLMNL